jgi:pSer/pThr/pTyr-binding forkhead associated (FHA) protein
MKVKLVVAQGVHTGKQIPLAGSEFAIGRDPQCQLRPSSPAISKKHCAVLVRGDKVFVRDFGSTNGTFVNGEAVQGEIEVVNGAKLKAGPLEFTVQIEATAEVKVPPKVAAQKPVTPKGGADDDFAAFLLEGDVSTAGTVPEGSTVMEMNIPAGEAASGEGGEKKADKPEQKKAEADTRKAADDILRLYQRRPRS